MRLCALIVLLCVPFGASAFFKSLFDSLSLQGGGIFANDKESPPIASRLARKSSLGKPSVRGDFGKVGSRLTPTDSTTDTTFTDNAEEKQIVEQEQAHDPSEIISSPESSSDGTETEERRGTKETINSAVNSKYVPRKVIYSPISAADMTRREETIGNPTKALSSTSSKFVSPRVADFYGRLTKVAKLSKAQLFNPQKSYEIHYGDESRQVPLEDFEDDEFFDRMDLTPKITEPDDSEKKIGTKSNAGESEIIRDKNLQRQIEQVESKKLPPVLYPNSRQTLRLENFPTEIKPEMIQESLPSHHFNNLGSVDDRENQDLEEEGEQNRRKFKPTSHENVSSPKTRWSESLRNFPMYPTLVDQEEDLMKGALHGSSFYEAHYNNEESTGGARDGFGWHENRTWGGGDENTFPPFSIINSPHGGQKNTLSPENEVNGDILGTAQPWPPIEDQLSLKSPQLPPIEKLNFPSQRFVTPDEQKIPTSLPPSHSGEQNRIYPSDARSAAAANVQVLKCSLLPSFDAGLLTPVSKSDLCAHILRFDCESPLADYCARKLRRKLLPLHVYYQAQERKLWDPLEAGNSYRLETLPCDLQPDSFNAMSRFKSLSPSYETLTPGLNENYLMPPLSPSTPFHTPTSDYSNNHVSNFEMQNSFPDTLLPWENTQIVENDYDQNGRYPPAFSPVINDLHSRAIDKSPFFSQPSIPHIATNVLHNYMPEKHDMELDKSYAMRPFNTLFNKNNPRGNADYSHLVPSSYFSGPSTFLASTNTLQNADVLPPDGFSSADITDLSSSSETAKKMEKSITPTNFQVKSIDQEDSETSISTTVPKIRHPLSDKPEDFEKNVHDHDFRKSSLISLKKLIPAEKRIKKHAGIPANSHERISMTTTSPNEQLDSSSIEDFNDEQNQPSSVIRDQRSCKQRTTNFDQNNFPAFVTKPNNPRRPKSLFAMDLPFGVPRYPEFKSVPAFNEKYLYPPLNEPNFRPRSLAKLKKASTKTLFPTSKADVSTLNRKSKVAAIMDSILNSLFKKKRPASKVDSKLSSSVFIRQTAAPNVFSVEHYVPTYLEQKSKSDTKQTDDFLSPNSGLNIRKPLRSKSIASPPLSVRHITPNIFNVEHPAPDFQARDLQTQASATDLQWTSPFPKNKDSPLMCNWSYMETSLPPQSSPSPSSAIHQAAPNVLTIDHPAPVSNQDRTSLFSKSQNLPLQQDWDLMGTYHQPESNLFSSAAIHQSAPNVFNIDHPALSFQTPELNLDRTSLLVSKNQMSPQQQDWDLMGTYHQPESNQFSSAAIHQSAPNVFNIDHPAPNFQTPESDLERTSLLVSKNQNSPQQQDWDLIGTYHQPESNLFSSAAIHQSAPNVFNIDHPASNTQSSSLVVQQTAPNVFNVEHLAPSFLLHKSEPYTIDYHRVPYLLKREHSDDDVTSVSYEMAKPFKI